MLHFNSFEFQQKMIIMEKGGFVISIRCNQYRTFYNERVQLRSLILQLHLDIAILQQQMPIINGLLNMWAHRPNMTNDDESRRLSSNIVDLFSNDTVGRLQVCLSVCLFRYAL